MAVHLRIGNVCTACSRLLSSLWRSPVLVGFAQPRASLSASEGADSAQQT